MIQKRIENTPEQEKTKPQYSIDIIASMAEHTIRRLWVVIIVLAMLLFGSNAAWLAYISGYDFQSYAVELSTDGGGNANYIGNDGDITNGIHKGNPADEN